MKPSTSYAIACRNASETQICSCDFRINIYGCPESSILVLLNWMLVSYCGLLSIMAAASLWHLIKKKDQAFFLPSRRDRGKIRPRPQHIYFAMGLTYCPFQVIHSILLLTNSYPNIFWAELGHTLPTALTTTTAILYPISILYSTSAFEVGTNFASSRPVSMSSVISEVPITRQAIKTDLACISTLIISFCLFLAVAALTGYYADINDYINADKLFLIQNFVWAIWAFLYLITMIWFWFRFINIVLENINDLTSQHQTQNSELQNKLEQLRKGTRNLSLPVYGQTITIIIFIPVLILYGLYHRSNTIFNYKINLVYTVLWYFTFPLILNITQGMMIYNIITTPLNNSTRNNSNNEKKDTNNDKTDDKKTSNNSKRTSEITGTSIRTDDVINEEETYNAYSKRSKTIRYSDQYIVNIDNEESDKINDEIVHHNKSTYRKSDPSPSKRRNSNSYTITSDTTLIAGGSSRPISPTMTNITSSTVTARFSSSMPSSPTSLYSPYSPYPPYSSYSPYSPTLPYSPSLPYSSYSPYPPYSTNAPITVNQNNATSHSQRNSINSNASNNDNSDSSAISSNQRKEWLTKKPAPALNRPNRPHRDSYKGSL